MTSDDSDTCCGITHPNSVTHSRLYCYDRSQFIHVYNFVFFPIWARHNIRHIVEFLCDVALSLVVRLPLCRFTDLFSRVEDPDLVPHIKGFRSGLLVIPVTRGRSCRVQVLPY